jgi:hypothetical protein
LSYRDIGIVIAREDGRKVPYTDMGVFHALKEYHRGIRDEDGERHDFVPATNRRPRPISLGPGIGLVLFPSLSGAAIARHEANTRPSVLRQVRKFDA